MTDRLDIWLYGTRLAHMALDASERIHLQWTSAARDRWGEGTRVLSAKLPIGSHPVPTLVRNYLDGLLPEGNARTNQAIAAGVPPDNTFGLIRAYGRDTPGAAVFVDPGSEDPTRAGRYEPISLDEVSERLRNADLHSPVRADHMTGESSTLPGMVPKITVHREGTTWFACKDGAPSTWILKRAHGIETAIDDIIDSEVACLALARAVELTTIQAEVIDFGDHRAIAVSRYDRPAIGNDPRLHQEDLAQAIGLNTSNPNRKFQYGARMPSLSDAASVLRIDGGNPDALLRLATFAHLVGNTDMHAKNISFLRPSDGRVALAPAYDVAMHLHHARDNRRFALDVNGKSLVDEVTVEDLVQEGVSWGLPRSRAARVVAETTLNVSSALGRIDRDLYPGVGVEAWELVFDRVEKSRLSSVGAKLVDPRKTMERRRQQQRLEEERRRLEHARLQDRETTLSLIGESEAPHARQIEAIREPRKEQLRILYATAAPNGDPRVDEEIRRVKAAVKASTHRDQISIEHLAATTPADLLDSLTSFRPHVVHFSGHANETAPGFDNGVDEHGPGRAVNTSTIKKALEALDEAPTLVVLNACRSAAHMESLLGKVPMAIGMSEGVGDVDALTFATRFYRILAEGQSVSAALATARVDMEMNGLPDADLPTLVTLPGLDPTTMRLVIAPE